MPGEPLGNNIFLDLIDSFFLDYTNTGCFNITDGTSKASVILRLICMKF